MHTPAGQGEQVCGEGRWQDLILEARGGGGAHSGTGSRSSCPQIHKDEIMRNRKRVKEINQYIDHVQSELDSLEYGDLLD